MFATMQAGEDRAGQAFGFDGYMSLSATLSDLLRGVGLKCGGPSTPLEGIMDELPSLAHIADFGDLEMLKTTELVSSDGSENESVRTSPRAVVLPRIVLQYAEEEAEGGKEVVRGRSRTIIA